MPPPAVSRLDRVLRGATLRHHNGRGQNPTHGFPSLANRGHLRRGLFSCQAICESLPDAPPLSPSQAVKTPLSQERSHTFSDVAIFGIPRILELVERPYAAMK